MVSDISALSRGLVGFGRQFHENVDDIQGLYAFWVRGTCLYVGMSMNLKNRMQQHCEMETNPKIIENYNAYGGEIDVSLLYLEGYGEGQLRTLESAAIRKFDPIANRRGKA